jgi:hypothetical protein
MDDSFSVMNEMSDRYFNLRHKYILKEIFVDIYYGYVFVLNLSLQNHQRLWNNTLLLITF